MADASLLLSRSSPGLVEDTDAFNVRLREINREMQGLLEKTNQHRQDLSRWHLFGGVAPVTAAAGPAAAAAAVANSAPSLTAFEVTEELRQWITSQVRSYVEAKLPDVVAPLVEQETNRRLQRWTNRVETVHTALEETKAVVDTLTEQWRDKQADYAAAIARIEHTTANSLQHYESDTAANTRKWLDELNAIRDDVSEMGSKYRLVEQRTARRLDDLARSHREVVSSSLTAMEQQVQDWKQQLSGALLEQTTTLRAELGTVESHIARLQGVLSSVSQASSRHVTDIKTLMESAVEQKSQMRSCRRDVNRLEMLVQSAAVGMTHPDEKDSRAAFLEGLKQNSDNPAASMLLAQELSQAKEQISFLSGRLEGLERHVHQMDTAMLSVSKTMALQARYAAETSYASHHNNTNINNGNGSMGNASWMSPTAVSRLPGVAPQLESTLLPHSFEGTPWSPSGAVAAATAAAQEHLRQQHHQQQQQMQRQATHPHVDPAGMNRSAQLAKGGAATDGGGGMASSHAQGPEPQELQPGSRLAAPASSHHSVLVNVERPRQASSSAVIQPEPFRELPRSENPSQRRLPPTVIPVEEGEDERAAAANGPHAEPARQTDTSHHSPIGERPESSAKYSALESGSLGLGQGAAENEDSYVSQSGSRGWMQSANNSQLGSSQLRRQVSDQYLPAPTSDSESDRENQNLSRLQID